MTPHRRLIAHELGHAIVGLLCGVRVQRVWAPPPPGFDGPPSNPDEPAGFVLSRGGDRRARALALLGGPLAEGKCAPSWPIRPRTSDERQLAEIVNEQDEVCYLECVRDAEQIVESEHFTRMNTLAGELLATPPHELDERQLDDLLRLKGHAEEGRDEPDPRELEAELVRRGVLSEPHAAEYAEAVTDILGTENGDHLEKAHHSRVRTEARDHMLNLFAAAELERKSTGQVKVSTFTC